MDNLLIPVMVLDGITWGWHAWDEKATEDDQASAEQLADIVAANGADRATCERRKLNNVRPGRKPQSSAQSDETIPV